MKTLCPGLAPLRHARLSWECPFVGVDRKSPSSGQTDTNDQSRLMDVNYNESFEIFTLTPPMAAIINPASSACRPVDAASATRASAQRPRLPCHPAQPLHSKVERGAV
jgi:hypothetical protein